MKRAQNIVLPVVAGIGLLAGGLYSQLIQNKNQENAEHAQTATTPEKGVTTDAFSLRLFQQMLQEQKGNVLAAPRVISETLRELSQLAGGVSKAELDALKLASNAVYANPAVVFDYLIALDINTKRNNDDRSILSLPFSENTPLALSIFNGTLAQSAPSRDAQFATSDMVNNRTKLLAGAIAYGRCNWEIPFLKADSRLTEFDSQSGAMPHHPQMRSRGNYRTAKAEDGAWKAVALPIKSSCQVLIGILPSVPARQFAAALTPEQLSGIRQALAEAQPTDTLVEFPRLELEVRPYDMRYTLRRLGLSSLFDTEKADFSGASSEHTHLGAVVHASGVWLVESPDKAAQATPDLDYAANVMSFSRPFIWFIADASSDTPFDFIGLVEEL